MEGSDKYVGITESTTDWESGDAPTPVSRMDYTRASQEHDPAAGLDDEANSDIGNLGRDVMDSDRQPATASRS